MKNKIKFGIFVAVLAMIMTGGLTSISLVAGNPNKQQPKKTGKTLIVYYSWSGNTKKVAQMIQTYTDAMIFELRPSKPYPLDFNECVEQAGREIREEYIPNLEEMIDVSAYDIIFIGTPNWWSTIATPLRAFFSKVDLSGKTIVPFCTHGTGGRANCFSEMQRLAPKTDFVEGFSVSDKNVGECETDLQSWLKALELIR